MCIAHGTQGPSFPRAIRHVAGRRLARRAHRLLLVALDPHPGGLPVDRAGERQRTPRVCEQAAGGCHKAACVYQRTCSLLKICLRGAPGVSWGAGWGPVY